MTEMFRKPTTEVNESIKSKLFLDQKSGSKTSARLSPQSQLFFGIVELGTSQLCSFRFESKFHSSLFS